MTTSVAWQRIGEAFERYAATGKQGKEQCSCCLKPLTYRGLCFAIDVLDMRTLRSELMEMPGTDGGYWWHSFGRAAAYERALFCYLMAEAEA